METIKIFTETLRSGTRDLGMHIDEESVEKFYGYFRLLVEWNEKMNLTGITAPDEAAIKHFVDSLSLQLVSELREGGKSGIDVGTGAGFPGMVHAIVNPNSHMTLLDSLEKRCRFLQTVKDELGVANVEITHARVEDFGRGEGREKFDFVVARAVAKLQVLTEYCIPLCREQGLFVAMKGPEGRQESQEAVNAIDTLGGRLIGLSELTLSDGSNRTLIKIQKVKETPNRYPRKAGTPSRRPL